MAQEHDRQGLIQIRHLYNAAVVMLGVGMMAIGAAGFAGRGPMRGGE